MVCNKNTAPGVSSTQSGGADSTAGSTSFSISQYSTSKQARQGRVEAYLREHGHFGRQCAISREALVEALGYPNVRKFRLDVAEERRNGGLILSTTRGRGGYFIPADGAQGRAEISEFVSSCDSRAVHVYSISKAARQALGVVDGQFALTLNAERGDGERD